MISGPTTNEIYEPRVDSWDGRTLVGRSVVGIQTAEHPDGVFGTVGIRALTLVDKTDRTVSLENINVTGGDFPSSAARSGELLKTARETFPSELKGVSVARVETALSIPRQQLKGTAEDLNNEPPRIIVSTGPAILVYVDGPPVYRAVKGTDLQRVINSEFLLLKDRSGQLYLHVQGVYMTASRLDGPWTIESGPPAGVSEAEKQALASPIPVDLLDVSGTAPRGNAAILSPSNAPAIYVSTRPAELITFDGQPNFFSIPGTRLLYAANTTANVFRLITDQRIYVLLSGRWFRAPSFEGPWQYVSANRLPQDFGNVPDDSPKENVKASVPGSRQATEALVANSIPQGAKVPRDAQMPNPQIDGEPELRPISGTPLSFVANSGTPIIKVDEGSWYACENGVWYTAGSVNGPWLAATSVPAVIYSIPPNSPMHYLTYVQVYGADSRDIYEGYTPGYLGTEVENGTVVYGTGYDYPSWIGDEWYGYPMTWGFGWDPCWTPWDDWGFEFGFGWGCGFGWHGWLHCHPPRPWWGGHHGGLVAWRRNDTASTARNVYARQTSNRGAYRRPMESEFARAYNSRTGTLAGGQRAPAGEVLNRAETQNAFRSNQGFQTHGRSARDFGDWRRDTAVGVDPGVYRQNAGQGGHGYLHAGAFRGGWGGLTHGWASGGGWGSGHGGSSGGHAGGGGGVGSGGGGGGHGGGGGGGGHR